MSDSAAFHEVDEAVRKDELKEWWNRWGTWVVAACVAVVVAAVGYVGWNQYDTCFDVLVDGCQVHFTFDRGDAVAVARQQFNA